MKKTSITAVFVDFFGDAIYIDFYRGGTTRSVVRPNRPYAAVGQLVRALEKRNGTFRCGGIGWVWVRLEV